MRRNWDPKKRMFNQKLYNKFWEVSNDIYDSIFEDEDHIGQDWETDNVSGKPLGLQRTSLELGEWLDDRTVNNQSQKRVIKNAKKDNSIKKQGDAVYINTLSGSPVKKNGTVYENHDDNVNKTYEVNTIHANINGEQEQKPKTKQDANEEEKRLRHYYLAQMEDLLNCYMVNVTSESLNPKYLAQHFGDSYEEGLCVPRKFVVSLKDKSDQRKHSCRVLFEVVGIENGLESLEDSDFVSIHKLRYRYIILYSCNMLIYSHCCLWFLKSNDFLNYDFFHMKNVIFDG